MAPKPAAKPTTPGTAPKGAAPAKGKDAPAKGKDDAPEDGGAAAPTSMAAPKNKEEVLAQVNLDGLPHCPNEQILEILREKYETLVAVFIHYCKQSECKTLEQATRLRLGALTPLPPTTMMRKPLPVHDVMTDAELNFHRSWLQETGQGCQPRTQGLRYGADVPPLHDQGRCQGARNGSSSFLFAALQLRLAAVVGQLARQLGAWHSSTLAPRCATRLVACCSCAWRDRVLVRVQLLPSSYLARSQGVGSQQDETLSLGVEQFSTLMVHLAFGRDYPRYVAAKESKKEETVPVLQCVQNLMNEFLPRMHKGNQAEFRQVLKADSEAQSVIASYQEKIGALIQKLVEKAEKGNSDVYTQFVAYLDEKGCLGTRCAACCSRRKPRRARAEAGVLTSRRACFLMPAGPSTQPRQAACR